jgi:hypothetical protein
MSFNCLSTVTVVQVMSSVCLCTVTVAQAVGSFSVGLFRFLQQETYQFITFFVICKNTEEKAVPYY